MVSSVYLTQAMFNVETRTTQMSKLTIIVTNFRRFRRGTLFGYATVYIPELRLSACDVAVHRHASGASWVALPARPVATVSSATPATAEFNMRNYSASTVAKSARPFRRPSSPRCSGLTSERSMRPSHDPYASRAAGARFDTAFQNKSAAGE
jgi:hypothetical protein